MSPLDDVIKTAVDIGWEVILTFQSNPEGGYDIAYEIHKDDKSFGRGVRLMECPFIESLDVLADSIQKTIDREKTSV